MSRNRKQFSYGEWWLCSIVALSLSLGLAACGGGGGGGGSTTPSQGSAITLSLQPTTITVGQAATLTWAATSAGSCTASGAWSGSEAATGTQMVTPTTAGSTTYTLTCAVPSGSGYGGGGSTTTAKSVTLIVDGAAATAYVSTSLVADTAGGTVTNTDTHLVNPWGIVFAPGAPVWVANNHSETSTLYDGNGKAQPAGSPLVVQLPSGPGGVTFDPTGIVFNSSTTDFVVTAGGKSGVASFIYSGEGGMIAGWSQNVDVNNAVTMYVDTGGAVYTGLALTNNGSGNFLYAADFHNKKVDVFDSKFAKQTPSATNFSFTDPGLPTGYAPFGIQAINNGAAGATQIYVTYAKQQAPDDHDNQNGAGLALVDVFDVNGRFVKQIIPAGGALNAPWGLALAPADFGTLSNALLVGNFGDGKINGYDASSGRLIGAVTESGGTPFAVPGLWGIAFGNDAVSQPHNALFYAAGLNDKMNGSYGRIDPPQ